MSFKDPVAKIELSSAEYLKSLDPDIDIQIDKNCVAVVHEDEATDHLLSTDFEIIEFEPMYIGAPRPKKRN